MDTFYPTPRVEAPYRSGGSIANRSFVAEAIKGRRCEALQLADEGVRFLQHGLEAGVCKLFLADTAKGLHDQISDLVGIMRRDLDRENLPTDGAEVDLSELDAMIAKIESPKRPAEMKEPSL